MSYQPRSAHFGQRAPWDYSNHVSCMCSAAVYPPNRLREAHALSELSPRPTERMQAPSAPTGSIVSRGSNISNIELLHAMLQLLTNCMLIQ